MTLLQLDQISSAYGATPVLFDVDLRVGAGQCVALLGRNGVGKTTLMRSVLAWGARVTHGRVWLDDDVVTGWPTHRRAAWGVQFVPEDRGIFTGLTVRENLRLAELVQGSGVEPYFSRDELLAAFPILTERMSGSAGVLSGGERQILAIVRALLANPRLLLIDEFSEGLQAPTARKLADLLKVAVGRGLALLMIDQDSAFAIQFADYIYVMEKGRIVDDGSGLAFQENPGRLDARLAF
jgi:branched-chain amino acid transport system ATP-binding protein